MHSPTAELDRRSGAVGSTLATGTFALVAGAMWAVLLSSGSLLAVPVSVPGSMAAGLLLAASYPAWSLSRTSDTSAILFPALLLLISFSELLAIHHDVEAASGMDWQVLYLPVLLLTLAIGWRTHSGAASTTLTRSVLIAAFLGWILALLTEAFQWGLVESSVLHGRLGTLKDGVEVVAAGSLFVALSLIDRVVAARDWR